MTKLCSAALLIILANAVAADETRQLAPHEHGVGQLDIAFDGSVISMALRAPGADIVGFEYSAESAEDRAKLDAAVATLARPLDLFTLPKAAGCTVVQASAALENEESHEDHTEHKAHEDHSKDEAHDHDDHAAHDTHAEHDHSEAEGHTEFHADYLLTCADPAEASLITFAYFDTFPNARELEVQIISDRGATAFEVERDSPTLDLRDMF